MTKENVKELRKVCVDEKKTDAVVDFGSHMYGKGITQGYLYMAFAVTAGWIITKCIDTFQDKKLKKELEEEES